MAKLLTQVDVREISIVPFGANNKKFLLVKEQNSNSKNPFWLKKEESKEVDDMVDGDAIKKEYEDKMRIEKEQFEAEKKKLEKEKADMAAEKEKLSKQLEDQKKAIEEKENLAKEALRLAKEEKDARILKEKVDYARDTLSTLGDSKEIGTLLKSAEEKLDAKEMETLTKILVGADEKIKKGDLFKEAGTDNHQSASGNVIERVNKMAEKIMVDEKVDYSTAISKVFERDQKLCDEYMKAGA
jgi:hypothetical protein